MTDDRTEEYLGRLSWVAQNDDEATRVLTCDVCGVLVATVLPGVVMKRGEDAAIFCCNHTGRDDGEALCVNHSFFPPLNVSEAVDRHWARERLRPGAVKVRWSIAMLTEDISAIYPKCKPAN